ncbi:uncharacterized protein LOC134025231 [Osmerus eperlanus]|uniref:uncharacterized protein LOC134025231 n=1 Tax=Osmerus eperlanus TaxID=29151 RepID=UPI002E11C39F
MSAEISMDNNCQKKWLLVPASGTNLEGRQLEEERRAEPHPSAGVPDPQRSGGTHATENQSIHHDPRDLGSSPLSLAQLVVPGSSAQPASPTGPSPHGSAQPPRPTDPGPHGSAQLPSPVIQALLESSVSDRDSSQQALHQALLVRALQQGPSPQDQLALQFHRLLQEQSRLLSLLGPGLPFPPSLSTQWFGSAAPALTTSGVDCTIELGNYSGRGTSVAVIPSSGEDLASLGLSLGAPAGLPPANLQGTRNPSSHTFPSSVETLGPEVYPVPTRPTQGKKATPQ